MTSTVVAIMTQQNPETQHDPKMLRSVRGRSSVPGPTTLSWPCPALALGKELSARFPLYKMGVHEYLLQGWGLTRVVLRA